MQLEHCAHVPATWLGEEGELVFYSEAPERCHRLLVIHESSDVSYEHCENLAIQTRFVGRAERVRRLLAFWSALDQAWIAHLAPSLLVEVTSFAIQLSSGLFGEGR